MKKSYRVPVIVLSIVGLIFAVGLASKAYSHEGCKDGKKHHMMKYDPKTVQTITGEVVKVKEFKHRRGTGIGLLLKTDKEEIPVHIGPSSFLEKQGFKIGEKDKLEVTGSRITGKKGKTFVLAAQVKKGDTVLKLRDENGKPVWAPMKERKMQETAPQTEPKPEMKQ